LDPLSRRDFLALAAAGRMSGPEWQRYSDPATELDVLRLTNPAFPSGMTASHLRQFNRRGDGLIYWSDRYEADSGAARQPFLLDLKGGGSRQLAEATALDPLSLGLSADDRSFYFFDGPSLKESAVAGGAVTEIHAVPEDAARSGFTLGSDGSAIFAERRAGKSRIVSVLRRQKRRILEIDAEIDELIARPRHPQIYYRTGSRFWLVNSDGSGKRELKLADGRTGEVLWVPSGRTLIYLHIPDNPKELVTLREHAPDDNADTLVARTSQFTSIGPNADSSVFTGASRSKASAYVLILLRIARRELTLCEHRASDPSMVRPIFSPESQSVLFVSDRHGKPALYQVHVGRFVEETGVE
jgi:oligogalacturonide lyase